MPNPHILDVIRMYRKERKLSLEEAKQLAIKEFKKRGWPLPAWFQRLENPNA